MSKVHAFALEFASNPSMIPSTMVTHYASLPASETSTSTITRETSVLSHRSPPQTPPSFPHPHLAPSQLTSIVPSFEAEKSFFPAPTGFYAQPPAPQQPAIFTQDQNGIFLTSHQAAATNAPWSEDNSSASIRFRPPTRSFQILLFQPPSYLPELQRKEVRGEGGVIK